MAGSGTAHLRPADQTLLHAEHLVVEFPVGRSGLKVNAVSDVSLDILEGETLGLVGESGCGKSTTARAMIQLPPPTSGSVVFEGQDLTKLKGEALRKVRPRMQMIFQDPISSLNPRRKIGDLVTEGLEIWGIGAQQPQRRAWTTTAAAVMSFILAGMSFLAAMLFLAQPLRSFSLVALIVYVLFSLLSAAMGAWFIRLGVALLAREPWARFASIVSSVLGLLVAWPLGIALGLLMFTRPTRDRDFRRTEYQKRADDVLDAVGLDPEQARGRRPHEFSGGQCQRISIARAVITEPKLILCDEPVSALDVSVQAQILNLLQEMKARFGLTLVFIAHDLAVVKNVSDRVAVMYLGKICEVAQPDELYEHPVHPYTAALLAAIPEPDPEVRPSERDALSGEIPSPVSPPSGCRFRTRCPKAQQKCAEEEPVIEEVRPGHFAACHFPLAEGEELDFTARTDAVAPAPAAG